MMTKRTIEYNSIDIDDIFQDNFSFQYPYLNKCNLVDYLLQHDGVIDHRNQIDLNSGRYRFWSKTIKYRELIINRDGTIYLYVEFFQTHATKLIHPNVVDEFFTNEDFEIKFRKKIRI